MIQTPSCRAVPINDITSNRDEIQIDNDYNLLIHLYVCIYMYISQGFFPPRTFIFISSAKQPGVFVFFLLGGFLPRGGSLLGLNLASSPRHYISNTLAYNVES